MRGGRRRRMVSNRMRRRGMMRILMIWIWGLVLMSRRLSNHRIILITIVVVLVISITVLMLMVIAIRMVIAITPLTINPLSSPQPPPSPLPPAPYPSLARNTNCPRCVSNRTSPPSPPPTTPTATSNFISAPLINHSLSTNSVRRRS